MTTTPGTFIVTLKISSTYLCSFFAPGGEGRKDRFDDQAATWRVGMTNLTSASVLTDASRLTDLNLRFSCVCADAGSMPSIKVTRRKLIAIAF